MNKKDRESLVEAVQKVANVTNSVQQALLSLADFSLNTKNMLGGFTEAMKAVTDRMQRSLEAHELNVKTGWWYPNSVLDGISETAIHNALKNEQKNAAFTKLVIQTTRQNNDEVLYNIHDRWRNYNFIPSRRKRILLDVLEAHINGKYTLSIPTALPQIEHYYKKLFPKSKEQNIKYKDKPLEMIDLEQKVNFARHFGRKDHMEIPASNYLELFPIYYYFKNVLFPEKPLLGIQKNDNKDLFRLSHSNSRHGVLHGSNANYSSEARSIKNILFLDKLLSIMNRVLLENTKKADNGGMSV